jgi:hypothetical protein
MGRVKELWMQSLEDEEDLSEYDFYCEIEKRQDDESRRLKENKN